VIADSIKKAGLIFDQSGYFFMLDADLFIT